MKLNQESSKRPIPRRQPVSCESNEGERRTNSTPSLASPCFAASFCAAFFVLPRPYPTQSPSTIARTTYKNVSRCTKNPTIDIRTHTGVVLDPSPTLPLYTHSTDFDLCCILWLNSAKCPTFVEYCPGGGENHAALDGSRGVLAERWPSGITLFVGAAPSEGGSPYSPRIIRYATWASGSRRRRNHSLTASSP